MGVLPKEVLVGYRDMKAGQDMKENGLTTEDAKVCAKKSRLSTKGDPRKNQD